MNDKREVTNLGMVGGTSGYYRGGRPELFNDTDAALATGSSITKIGIRSGEIVDGIEAWYDDVALKGHGGQGGAPRTVVLDEGDHLVEVFGYYGDWFGAVYVLQVAFLTSNGKRYPDQDYFGSGAHSSRPKAFRFTAGEGEEIIAFSGARVKGLEADGSLSWYICALGAIAATIVDSPPPPSVSEPFDDGPQAKQIGMPITALRVQEDDTGVIGIQAVNGITPLPIHGTVDESATIIQIDYGDFLNLIQMICLQVDGIRRIARISFRTDKERVYSPYGIRNVTSSDSPSCEAAEGMQIIAFSGETTMVNDPGKGPRLVLTSLTCVGAPAAIDNKEDAS